MTEQTITIQNKLFEFERITLKKNFELRKYFLKFQKLGEDDLRYKELLKKLEARALTEDEMKLVKKYLTQELQVSFLSYWKDILHWHRFCRMIFKKNFLWKYFFILPKELRYNTISIQDAKRIQENFFLYWTGGQSAQNEQLNISNAIVHEKQVLK